MVQSGPHLVGRVGTSFPLIARHQGATRDDAGDTGQPDPLPHVAHPDRLYPPMVHGVDPSTLALDRALNETRTGDLWLFRGRSRPDRAIQTLTNAPVNHVGMTVAIDDLPPLIWHAELGDKLLDVWTGTNHRGVQLNDARQVVQQWAGRYRQRCWLRQLTPHANRDQEDKLLRVIARMNGTPFPTTARLTGRWLRGRLPTLNDWLRGRCWTARCANKPSDVSNSSARWAWRRHIARRRWPSPMRKWDCWSPTRTRTGSTPASSEAVTRCPWRRVIGWVTKSRSTWAA
ncbi:LOW QUALITY PROTEIN: conserved hypothetical protein, partial [Mycobacterium tuberculosis variant africanum K85]